MKKLFTTLLLLTAFAGVMAQNCGRVDFPAEMPDSVCATDNDIHIIDATPSHGNFELWGEGITYVVGTTGNAYFFSPDEVQLQENEHKTVELHYGTVDDCEQWVEVSIEITVSDCEQDCGTVGEHLEFPEEMCSTDNPISIQPGSNHNYEVTGNGVTYTNGTYYFDPSEVNGTTGTVVYGAFDDCQNWQTVTFEISIKTCNNECGTIGDHLEIPESICNTARAIFITGPQVEDGPYEIWGDGITQDTHGDFYFDPTAVNQQFAVIHYGAYDDCEKWQTITFDIIIEDCTVNGFFDQNTEEQVEVLPNHVTTTHSALLQVQGATIKTYRIHTLQGQLQVAPQNYHHGISTAGLEHGYYIITVTTTEGDVMPLKLLVD